MGNADIEQLFRPTSASVRQLLSDHVGGFAIPSYQRPYRWQPSDVKRLLEDLLNGMRRLRSDSDAVTFIGAIITLSDVSGHHPTRPREAKQIIDGQQRLTTLLMLMIILHQELLARGEKLLKVAAKVEDGQEKTVLEWVREQIAETTKQLMGCLAEERGAGDGAYRMLPKVVREIADSWSNKSATARYISPIAHLLHSYIRYTHNYDSPNRAPFKPGSPDQALVPEPAGSSKEDHKTLELRYDQLAKYLKQITRGKEQDLPESIEIDLLLGPNSLLDDLFDSPPSLSTTLLENVGKRYRPIVDTLRLLVFTRFMLDRVAMTQINAKDETYAFDLFDSLNTTGEPLTALETFHPLVVEAETRDNYQSSPSFHHMSTVSNLVSEHEGTVQRETARLVTSFLLADAGLKVATRHNDQRRELTKRYRTSPDIAAGRQMTQHLADVGLTYFRLWERGELLSRLDADGVFVNEPTKFCLRFLKHINHSVTVAPIARYFSAWRELPSDSSKETIEQSIRAITAFSVLWRAAHGGTDGIDSVYRSLMQRGVTDVMPPLARTSSSSHDIRPLPILAKFLAGLWKEASSHKDYGFESRDEWVELAYARPIYEEQYELARFLLLLAAHHAIPDGTTGLTKNGAHADHTNMLSSTRWEDERLATIEHVSPQTSSLDKEGRSTWDATIYSDPTVRHRIGNLTLVPLDDNSVLSNRTWKEKRYLYRALSADSPDEASNVLNIAKADGVELTSQLRQRILDGRRHLPVLRAIAERTDDWTADFVNDRGKHLLTRCWGTLISWLPQS